MIIFFVSNILNIPLKYLNNWIFLQALLYKSFKTINFTAIKEVIYKYPNTKGTIPLILLPLRYQELSSK